MTKSSGKAAFVNRETLNKHQDIKKREADNCLSHKHPMHLQEQILDQSTNILIKSTDKQAMLTLTSAHF